MPLRRIRQRIDDASAGANYLNLDVRGVKLIIAEAKNNTTPCPISFNILPPGVAINSDIRSLKGQEQIIQSRAGEVIFWRPNFRDKFSNKGDWRIEASFQNCEAGDVLLFDVWVDD